MDLSWRAGSVAVLLLVCCSAVPAAPAVRMDSRAAPTEAEYARVRSPDPLWLSNLRLAQTIGLGEPSALEFEKRAAAYPNEKRYVAFGRPTDVNASRVTASPGESAIKFLVTSANAIHLRVALRFTDAAQYRITAFRPGDETRAVTLYRKNGSASEALQTVWTPVTDGNAQIVVVEQMGESTGPWGLDVPLISHFDSPLYRARDASPENFGDSQLCQVDVACVYEVAPTVMQPGLVDANFGVALMSFTKADGFSYLCTGTLINTASFPSPLFLTAFHCLSDAQSLESLTTIWFFNRVACRSGPPTTVTTQVAGGAIAIFRSQALDAALVLLNQMPPVRATFTGWDASTMQPGTTILALHHPSGDVKKASFGTELGINDKPIQFDIEDVFPAGTFYVVSWQLGSVEHGSSGSGLLSFDPVTNLFYLRGTLTGGDLTCTTNGATTYYSRLDNLYPHIQAALTEPLQPPTPTVAAVEYYYDVWNFYFETSFADEIAALDGGAFGGAWKRTGQTFKVWPQATGSASAACRFFSTAFTPKSSHFYTPFASECAIVKTESAWQYEAIAFYIQLADTNGFCPAGTIPLYRLYNNGMGGAPNHRYTTSLAVFNQMTDAGWIFEGDGNTKVFACVPP